MVITAAARRGLRSSRHNHPSAARLHVPRTRNDAVSDTKTGVPSSTAPSL